MTTHHPKFSIHSALQLAMDGLTIEKLLFMALYHYQSYRVEGWGWAGTHKMVGKDYDFTKNNQMTSVGAIFTSTCHTKQLNPWANSSASRVVIHSHYCLLRKAKAIWRPPKHMWMSDRLEKEAWVKADRSNFSSTKYMWCWSIDVIYSNMDLFKG